MIHKTSLRLREQLKLDDILSRRTAEIKQQNNIEIMQDNLTIKPEILSQEILEFSRENKNMDKK